MFNLLLLIGRQEDAFIGKGKEGKPSAARGKEWP